jgi:hypothetical protein
VRRAYRGVHHHISEKYLDWYITELSWREDRTHLGNGRPTLDMLGRVLPYPTSITSCNANDSLVKEAHSSGPNSFLMKEQFESRG